MMAVRGALGRRSTAGIACLVDMDARTIQLWVARSGEDGIDGLRDAPGRGKPPRVAYKWIRRVADRLSSRNMLTPQKLQGRIRKKANCGYGHAQRAQDTAQAGILPQASGH